MNDVSSWIEQGRMADGKRMSDERLSEVFDLVKPSPNWKYPIDSYVDKNLATRAEIEAAVVWFAGGFPDVHDDGGSNVWYVSGAGYYEWIGA